MKRKKTGDSRDSPVAKRDPKEMAAVKFKIKQGAVHVRFSMSYFFCTSFGSQENLHSSLFVHVLNRTWRHGGPRTPDDHIKLSQWIYIPPGKSGSYIRPSNKKKVKIQKCE